MSQTQSQKENDQFDKQSSSQFQPKQQKKSLSTKQAKSKSKKKRSKQISNEKGKKKGGKKKQQKPKPQKPQKAQKAQKNQKPQKTQKVQKGNKQAKEPKQVKKKPKSKKVGGSQSYQQNKQKVKDYMKKQNRPYNLLNVFDNLHGKIKKPQLQTILNELSDENELSSKQFGKNKVYYLNQDKFDLNMTQVQEMGSTYTHLRQQHKELKDQNKALNDQYRKLMAKKTDDQMELDIFGLISQIQKLKKKKQYLLSGDIIKVDQKYVIQIQKQAKLVDKQLKKRKKLTKQLVDMWSEILQKKPIEAAQIMGIQFM